MGGQNWAGTDDNKMNSQFQRLLANQKKSVDSAGHDVKDIPHKYPGQIGGTYNSPMNTGLMTFTQLLEAMDMVVAYLEQEGSDPMNDPVEDLQQNMPAPTDQPAGSSEGDPNDPNDNADLMDQLNKIFTPVLVMQGFENEVADKIQESISEANLLTEQNIIKFDDQTRMAQLIATCALLIARKRNTPDYQMYHKAHIARNQAKLNIQKQFYDEAKALAQQFLVKVSTTNNSSVARDAANSLLPETQH